MNVKGIITAVVVGGAVLSPIGTAQAADRGPWCQRLATQPAYTYVTESDAVVRVPSGRHLMRVKPGRSERACKALVREYRSHASAKAKGRWCKVLRTQPRYSYWSQGNKITIPSGKKILRGGEISNRACKALVKEYRRHTNGAQDGAE